MQNFRDIRSILIAAALIAGPVLFAEEKDSFSGREAEDDSERKGCASLNFETICEFRDLDRNLSKTLGKGEFSRSRLAHLVFQVAGKSGVDNAFIRFDVDSGGDISLSEFAGSQLTRNLQLLDEDELHRFFELDSDLDGFLDQKEFPNQFETFDVNGTGKIGPCEFRSQYEAKSGVGESSVDKDVAELEMRFLLLDRDDNGKLSVSEFEKIQETDQNSELAPEAYDLNGNGEICMKEYLRAMGRTDPGEVDRMSREWFEKLDRNRNGMISRREYSRSPFAKHSGDRERIDEAFQKIDEDGDNGISINEYGKRFSRLKNTR